MITSKEIDVVLYGSESYCSIGRGESWVIEFVSFYSCLLLRRMVDYLRNPMDVSRQLGFQESNVTHPENQVLVSVGRCSQSVT